MPNYTFNELAVIGSNQHLDEFAMGVKTPNIGRHHFYPDEFTEWSGTNPTSTKKEKMKLLNLIFKLKVLQINL